MKIGVDIRVLMDRHYSGISEYAHRLLEELLKQDQENEYYLYYNSFRNLSKRFAYLTRDRVKLVATHWPNKIFNYIFQFGFAYPKIDKFLGDIDIFWSPHFNFSSFSDKPKVVLTVHDLSFLRAPYFFSWRKNFWHRLLGIKALITRANAIIAVSEHTKRDLLDLSNVPLEKVRVVYSGLNFSAEQMSEAREPLFVARYNLHGRFILSVGNIEPRKNLSGLIRAYDLLRKEHPEFNDCRLVLAGGRGWRNRQIYRLARRSIYRQEIIFLGYVSAADKDWLYRHASVFAYPSFYEGFGFPPLEAMSYGVPVITSQFSSLPEVVGDAAILINPGAANEIADALSLILGDGEIRDRLREAGLARTKIFSWEKTAAEYLAIFKKLKEE